MVAGTSKGKKKGDSRASPTIGIPVKQRSGTAASLHR